MATIAAAGERVHLLAPWTGAPGNAAASAPGRWIALLAKGVVPVSVTGALLPAKAGTTLSAIVVSATADRNEPPVSGARRADPAGSAAGRGEGDSVVPPEVEASAEVAAVAGGSRFPGF